MKRLVSRALLLGALVVLPSVANLTSSDVWAYGLDPINGGLAPITGSPFGVGTNPMAVTTTGAVQ